MENINAHKSADQCYEKTPSYYEAILTVAKVKFTTKAIWYY